MVRIKSFLKILVIVFFFLILLIFLGEFIFNSIYQFPQKIEYGVTFSPRYAGYLKLDWQKIYIQMLNDLKVKHLRIPSYWDILEPNPGQYDFSETDFMLDEAEKKGARVIMVLGERQPRWPECHVSEWAKRLKLQDRQQKILEFVQKTVERYKDHPAIWAWQIENEPLLRGFGENCGIPDKIFLKKEAILVRSLSDKTIIMTDSGELGFWITPAEFSDVFGTTLYRKVHDRFFGYIIYPLPPYFYSLKSSLVRNIFARSNKKTIIVELQAEPWLASGAFISPEEQTRIFTPENFRDYVNFAKKTGFDEQYLWGVEWWYFMAQQGYPEYLESARVLFK
ncbi:MAG: beta-galactosidase [Candidatus Daviesbacteria bacterium]|nr:beta-galactosidase [Candidatus Daviesbacteria bacterium]